MAKLLPLLPDREYIFIDSQYTDTFKEAPDGLLGRTGLPELRKVLFPYADDPYALFRAEGPFEPSRIRYVEVEQERHGLRHFCSDTGLIVVVETAALPSFLDVFDSGDFYFEYVEDSSHRARWETALAPFAQRFYWFFTSEIDPAFAGGGSFRIT